MDVKISKCILIFAAILFIVGSNHLCFAESESISAEKMWGMAEKKAKSLDMDAMIVKAKYNAGDQALHFRRGEFIFYAPNNPDNSNFSIKISNAKITKVRNAKYGNLNSSGIDPLPKKAVETALKNGLKEWWQNYPDAALYILLIPRKYYSNAPGTGDWVWRITGSGPGLPEDIQFFINAETFEYLGKKVKPIKKSYQNMTEKQASDQVKKILQDALKK